MNRLKEIMENEIEAMRVLKESEKDDQAIYEKNFIISIYKLAIKNYAENPEEVLQAAESMIQSVKESGDLDLKQQDFYKNK